MPKNYAQNCILVSWTDGHWAFDTVDSRSSPETKMFLVDGTHLMQRIADLYNSVSSCVYII